MIKVLPGDIFKEIMKISEELKTGYDLKELFLDIVNHTTYEEAKVEILNWIDLCKESKIKEFIEVAVNLKNNKI